MTTVTIFRNAIDPTDCDVFHGVEDTAALLVEQMGGKFPDTARIYHRFVAKSNDVTPQKDDETSIDRLQSLEGNIYVVIWPEGPVLIIAIVAIALAAVAIGLAFLLRPSTQGQSEGSPNNELSDRTNKPRPNERIPDIFGTVRSTPDLLVLPYKIFVGGQEFEFIYGCIGRDEYEIIDCLDGQTPIGDIDGEFVAVYPPFNSPNSDVPAPTDTFGTLPTAIEPIVTVEKSNAVNGQVLRAPNSGSIESYNNIAFATGGVIKTNDGNLDFTQYFVASTLTQDAFMTIAENDDGLNADDPLGVQPSVGLGGTYKVLSVTTDTIVLSVAATVNANWNTIALYGGGQSTYYHTFWLYNASTLYVGPFILNVNTMDQVWATFVAQNGLYYIDNKGRQGALHVTVKLFAQAIDATNTPIGDEISATVDLNGSSLNKNIVGATLKMALPSIGPCQVRALLITNMATDTRNSYSQEIQWRDLFAVSPVTFDILGDPAPGELVAFAKPTVHTFGPGGGFVLSGSAYADNDGALLSMQQSGPLANWYWAAEWSVFQLPTDMPADAVITRIVPIMAAEATGSAGSGGTLADLFGGDNTLNPYTPAPGGMLAGYSEGGDYQGVYSGSNLGTDITNVKAAARVWNTSSTGGFNRVLSVSRVVMAVYYTSASNGRSAPLQAAFGDFGNVTTVLAITAQTQDALSVKERKLNLLVTRKVPTWINRTDPGLPQFSTTKYASNNVADIACAMMLDPTIGRRVVSEIDVAEIYAVADSAHLGGEHVDGEIVSYFGTFLMAEFCYTFDDSSVSFEQALAFIGQAINSIFYRAGSTIGLSFEKKTDLSKILFNHRNKIPDSEQRTTTFGPLNDNDGINYAYVDPNAPNLPDQDTTLVLYFPPDQSAINPKVVQSVGVRNPLQATVNGARLFQKLMLANTQSEFVATQESNQVLINDRVLVADDTRTGTQAGQFKTAVGLMLTTSQPLTFEAGHTYTAFIQHYDASVESIAATAGAQPNQLVLATAPALPIVTDPELWAQTTYILVDDADLTAGGPPLAFLVQKKDPQDNGTFKLQTINYDDLYYFHDQDFNNGNMFAPPAGYGPQGYIGQGLVKADGTGYTPPARTPFNGGYYASSPLNGQNNPNAPIVNPPTLAPTTEPIQFNGASGATADTNFTDATPAAPAGMVNVKWQKGGTADLTEASAYVPLATGATPGVVPALPAVTPLLKFLRGDGTFVVPALATPTQPGFAPTLPADITKFLRGDGAYALPTITSGVAPFEVDALTAAAIAYIAKGYQGPKYVQSTNALGTGSGSLALAFVNNVVAGNLLVAFWYQSILAGPSITDSQGNTWTQIASATGSFGIVGVICCVATASASGPLTITASGARAPQSMMIAEYFGVTSLVADSAVGQWHYPPQASPLSATTITASQSDVIIAAFWKDDTNTAITHPTGMSIREVNATNGYGLADMNVNAGTYPIDWGFAPTPSTNSVATITLAMKGDHQTGDLFQFYDGYSGVKLSSVDAKGHWVNAITSGAPTIAAPTGAQAYDPATGILWSYNGTAWVNPNVANVLATVGDLIVGGAGGAGGAPMRLAAGTLNYVFTSNGPANVPSWQPSAGGGGGGGGVPVAMQDVDYPPASPGTLDDEFTDSIWNTNTKWTWVSQVGAAATQVLSYLKLTSPGTNGTGAAPSSIVQAMPSGVWEVTAEINFSCGSMQPPNNMAGGICVMDSSTGHCTMFYRGSGNGGGSQRVGILRPGSAWVQQFDLAFTGKLYMRVHDDGTNFLFSYSFDGANWIAYYSTGRTVWNAAPNKVGISVYADGNTQGNVGCDWFRRTV